MEAILNSPSAPLTQYGPQQAIHLEDASGVAVARRVGAELARNSGFDEARAGQVALVITEAATNIVKHASFGQILLRRLTNGDRAGIEIIALDKGPGIADFDWHAADGNSTAGTYGIGLGTLQRLTHMFDVYSQPDKGTVLWMEVWGQGVPPVVPPIALWQVGAVCVPMPGESDCGDNWAVSVQGESVNWVVADGLGHGLGAAIAADAAVALVDCISDETPAGFLQRAHSALRATRGAAVAAGQIDKLTGQVHFAGIGNIAACVQRGQSTRHLVSHNGIVGNNLRKVQQFSEAWDDEALFIAHSDGVSTRWNILSYPGLLACHPAIVAAVIYRDFARGRDDATVLVLRETPLARHECVRQAPARHEPQR